MSEQGLFLEDLLVWGVERGRFAAPVHGALDKSGRAQHCAVAWEEKLIVFGGRANGYNNDVHVFDSTSEKQGWRQIVPAESCKELPSPRYGAASCLVVLAQKTFWLIHGGYDSDASLNGEAWLWDFDERMWSKVAQTGAAPAMSPRMHHGLVSIQGGQSALLWGGKDKDGACGGLPMILDVATGHWSSVKMKHTKKKTSAPAPRWGFSMTLLPSGPGRESVLIFGGRDKEQVFGDAWILDLQEGVWSRLDGEGPGPRAFHSATRVNDLLVVFGGQDAEGKTLNSLFKVNR